MVRWRVLSANTALTFLFFRLFFLQIVFGGCFSNIFSLTKLLHIHNLVNAARGDDSKLTPGIHILCHTFLCSTL